MKNIKGNKAALNKLLVVSPHQDDFIIGCGGTLLKHREKTRQGIIFFYNIINQLETRSSLKLLNIDRCYYLSNKSRDFIFNQKSLFELIEIFRQFKPISLLVVADDGDRDHKVCSEICLEAAWLAGTPFFPKLGKLHDIENILIYSVWSECKKPHIIENIDDQIQSKLKAIRMHRSQNFSFAYDDLIVSRDRIYGLLKGCKYAEAFRVVKVGLDFQVHRKGQ